GVTTFASATKRQVIQEMLEFPPKENSGAKGFPPGTPRFLRTRPRLPPGPRRRRRPPPADGRGGIGGRRAIGRHPSRLLLFEGDQHVVDPLLGRELLGPVGAAGLRGTPLQRALAEFVDAVQHFPLLPLPAALGDGYVDGPGLLRRIELERPLQ